MDNQAPKPKYHYKPVNSEAVLGPSAVPTVYRPVLNQFASQNYFKISNILVATFCLLLIASVVAFGIFYLKSTANDGFKDSNNTTTTANAPENNANTREETILDESSTQYRQKYLRRLTSRVFSAYTKIAWIESDLKPAYRQPYNQNTTSPLYSLTIVNALSTLWLMELKEEWTTGKDWITGPLHLNNFDQIVEPGSPHETITSYIGGLLSAYALSGDESLLFKTKEVYEVVATVAFDRGSSVLPKRFYSTSGDFKAFEGTNMAFQLPEIVYFFNLTKNIAIGDWFAASKEEIKRATTTSLREYKGNFAYGFEALPFTSLQVEGPLFYHNLVLSYGKLGQDEAKLASRYREAIDSVLETKLTLIANEKKMIKNYKLSTSYKTCWQCELGRLYALSSLAFQLRNSSTKYQEHLRQAEQETSACHQAASKTQTGLLPLVFKSNSVIRKNADIK